MQVQPGARYIESTSDNVTALRPTGPSVSSPDALIQALDQLDRALGAGFRAGHATALQDWKTLWDELAACAAHLVNELDR